MGAAVQTSQSNHDPDLLSHVSELKQDLIKMSAILTTDAPTRPHPVGGYRVEQWPVEVPGEPLERMEQDLEEVKEDLAKVSEILRSGTFQVEVAEDAVKAARVAEDWVILTDREIQDAKKMEGREVQEAVLRENRGNRGAPRPKAIKDSGDLKEYLLDVPVGLKAKEKKEMAQESLLDILRKRTKPQDVASCESKKLPRRKGKDPGQREGSADGGGLLHVPGAPTPASLVSPVIEETPIGSIRDKAKALQQKVEAEEMGRSVPGSKPVLSKPSPRSRDESKSMQGPPKGSPESPKAGCEETMSVRELMQVFQTGQAPSKRKSGLFEHKMSRWSDKSMTQAETAPVPGGREVSLDAKPSKKEVQAQVPLAGLRELADVGSTGLDDSPDSMKHDARADSLNASSGDGSQHMSSENSYKHEGLATPWTSPESLCLPHKTGEHDVKESQDPERFGVGTAGDQVSTEMRPPVPPRDVPDQHATSESCSAMRSESKSKRQKLTKSVSETVETFLSDEDSPDHRLELPLVGLTASRSSSQCPESSSPSFKQDSDVLSPLADDSLTISHRDSLDGSPLPDENSSHKSPDSIEPSPTNETPPHDSLETSPVEHGSYISLLSSLKPPSESSNLPEPFKSAECPHKYLHGRLLQDPEVSAEENSFEQISQRTSSGKSPLSPDTPSSEEVSYEVTPNPPAHPFHSLPSKPSVIPEDPEEGSRKVTPEEEMFKMAAKIKTFEEMEEDARSQMNLRKDLGSGERVEPSSEKSRVADALSIGLSVDPHVKVQSPFPFSAGVHEGSNRKDVKSVSEGHCVSNLQLRLPKQPEAKGEEEVSLGKRTSVQSNPQNRTDEQKEQSLKKSREKAGEDRKVQGPGPEGGASKKDSNVTDEMKGDQIVLTGASRSRTFAETLKAEESVYDDEDEDVREPPKTESKGVTARVGAESWREDHTAFAACVAEEEQKILNLVVDRQSLQATPDTTPGRTPTEDSTPTSEPNPFLFQEGKLFEMTRSGAIDMTKRSYEEDGGAFAFFQISEQHPEPCSEDIRRDGAGAAEAKADIGLNLILEVKPDDQPTPDAEEQSSTTDTSKFKIPKMGLLASTKLAKKDQTPTEGVDGKTERNRANAGGVDADGESSEQLITNVQAAESTVTRPVYSQQTQESSDSSPEESQLVLEAPKAANKSKENAPSRAKKVPGKPMAKAAPPGQGKTTVPSPCHAVAPSTARKTESLGPESKSKIPIKASGVKADPLLKRAESNRDKKLKVPEKKETRRKSEADAGPSVGAKPTTASPKARSFCVEESSRPAAKSRSFQSRLPVRGKSGRASAPATPTKDRTTPLPESVEFFEEIGDEAAKLVARLVQAERAKANPDEDSGLLEASLRDRDSFPESSGDVSPNRPQWGRPAKTQTQRIPDDRAQSQGTPVHSRGCSLAP